MTRELAGSRRQRGVTLFGLLFWAIVIGFGALITMRVLPTLNEYFTVQRAVEKVAKEGGTTVPEIRAAFVPLPSQIEGGFLPRPAAQRYTCLGPDRYRYEGLMSRFATELAVEPDAMVLDYPGYFRRLRDPAGA